MNAALDLSRHPCFNAEVKGRYGRVHLPVAPKCNIKCNYCNRKYDCVNESRPGVTSSILTPVQAVRYVEQVLEQEPRITVAGIAGPGDPFANPKETLETMRRIKERFPDMLLCLATNGLGLAPYLDDVAEIGVTHVTITVNAVEPEVGQHIYSWVRDGKVVYRGIAGARLLLERQLEAIKGLKSRGVTVKINVIVIPGVNDHHVPAVARKMKELGADILNCMPMYPNEDTPFADIPEPTRSHMEAIRSEAETFLPQMRHCTRCRADAVGLLDNDRTEEFRGCLSACSALPAAISEEKPYVAVATLEGILVNQHLGEADRFEIWQKEGDGFRYVETRPAPAPGSGPKRWFKLAETLKDCRAVLISAIGETPRQLLTEYGILPVETDGFIEIGLKAVFRGEDLSRLKGRRQSIAKGGCCSGGGGGGCM